MQSDEAMVARAKHGNFDGGVDRRLSNQRARTRAGWKNGDLTRREMKRIRKDQQKTSSGWTDAQAGTVVTPGMSAAN